MKKVGQILPEHHGAVQCRIQSQTLALVRGDISMKYFLIL
jgi:hypothetical protein